MQEDLDFTEDVMDIGARLQINADSILGEDGRRVKKYCKQLLAIFLYSASILTQNAVRIDLQSGADVHHIFCKIQILLHRRVTLRMSNDDTISVPDCLIHTPTDVVP